MSEVKKSAFSLLNYRFNEAWIKFPVGGLSQDTPIGIELVPTGEFNREKAIYTVFIQLRCAVEGDEFLRLRMSGEFKFEEATTKEQIEEYFYINSVAILFPFLRAFTSTITLQGNAGLVLLPLLNLSSLGNLLKQSTKET